MITLWSISFATVNWAHLQNHIGVLHVTHHKFSVDLNLKWQKMYSVEASDRKVIWSGFILAVTFITQRVTA